jgi:hypothetical protein
MTTILAVFLRGSGCVGFCSARCYNAMPPEKRKGRSSNPDYARSDSHCDCICGGANHAMGLARSIKNRDRNIGLTLEAKQCFALEHGYAADDLVVIDRLSVHGYEKARRRADAMFDPKPLPLFECEGFGGKRRTERRRPARETQRGAGAVPSPNGITNTVKAPHPLRF